ncbi:MAG: hypothetical protein IJU87_05680 [Lachnospiraceae bacterium]|nr:hypothetical protein [Lachnospiraceae bacterium]
MNVRFKQISFLCFEDLLEQIIIEMDRQENGGESIMWDDEGCIDEDFFMWANDSLSEGTKSLMLEKGLPPALYAELLGDSFLWCQTYPDADFDGELRKRLSMHLQGEEAMKSKGMEVEHYPGWRDMDSGGSREP